MFPAFPQIGFQKDDVQSLFLNVLGRNHEKEIRLIQDNELRNPAYNGQFPIPTLQEYIDGKSFTL